jgi:homoserine dehydrogenase
VSFLPSFVHRACEHTCLVQVELKSLPLTDPLASMSGATAVVKFFFDDLAPISIVSHDPANADTAYGLYADLLTAVCGDGSGLGRLRSPPSAI